MNEFQYLVNHFYMNNRRDLPWRKLPRNINSRFYVVLVSEIMLQQTQVSRVIPKYTEFLNTFPTMSSLADASLADILQVWNGLGYNRRARYLRESARIIRDDGLPKNIDQLSSLPGIGHNTAGAIMAYVYNYPSVFIETNIRTVFIHHFFSERTNVHDKEILRYVEESLHDQSPREWYWALMDYGTYLKSQGLSNKTSAHYTAQSKFTGSTRELRAKILRLLQYESLSEAELHKKLTDSRLSTVLKSLEKDQLIEHGIKGWRISG